MQKRNYIDNATKAGRSSKASGVVKITTRLTNQWT